MKKIIFLSAVVAAVMSVSCQKTGNPSSSSSVSSETPVIEDNSISFGVKSLYATKAVTGTTVDLIEKDGFNVAGVRSDTTLMFNELASKVAESSPTKFKTANTYYWPGSGTMDFYACYPVSETITVNSGVATIVYSQDDTKDLVVAKKTSHPVGSDVSLAFAHALAQLNFTAQGTDNAVTYKITKIVVKGVSGGTYAYAGDSWTRLSTTSDMTFLETATDVATADKTVLPGDATFVPGAIQITANWETYIGTSKIAEYEASTAAITEASAVSIEKGKKNTVNLKLPNSSAVEILFTISLEDWGETSQDVTLNN